MSLAAAVEAAWTAAIWNSDVVRAITPNNFPYEVTIDSETELKQLHHAKEYNYFEWIVSAVPSFPLIGGGLESALYLIDVDIRYTIVRDTTGSNYQVAKAVPNTITNLVCTALQETWSETVDLFEIKEDVINVQPDKITETDVWRVVFGFTAQKFTTLS